MVSGPTASASSVNLLETKIPGTGVGAYCKLCTWRKPWVQCSLLQNKQNPCIYKNKAVGQVWLTGCSLLNLGGLALLTALSLPPASFISCPPSFSSLRVSNLLHFAFPLLLHVLFFLPSHQFLFLLSFQFFSSPPAPSFPPSPSFSHGHSEECSFIPTSFPTNSGTCCSLALSKEVLFSIYRIFKERNVTVLLIMKLPPFDIIRPRKYSISCLGDICRYYSNGRIGEFLLCFFVFFLKTGQNPT